MSGKKGPVILEHGTYTIKARLVDPKKLEDRNVSDIVSVPPIVAIGDSGKALVGFDTWNEASHSEWKKAFDKDTGDILVKKIYRTAIAAN